MSWWDIGEDVIGDTPADIMSRTLGDIARAREQRSRAKPTLQEILDGFAAALRGIDDGRRYTFGELVALRRSGPAVAANGDGANDQLVSALRRASDEIETEYQQRFERKPRLSEFLHTLSFVIGHEPERFFSGAQGMEVDGIVAE